MGCQLVILLTTSNNNNSPGCLACPKLVAVTEGFWTAHERVPGNENQQTETLNTKIIPFKEALKGEM